MLLCCATDHVVTVDGGLLMASDDPTSDRFGPVQGMMVSYDATDATDAARVFNALADGGTVQVPFDATFFSIGFGMCTDSYGTPWMVNTNDPNNPGPAFMG